MSLRHYINGVEVLEPKGVRDLTQAIVRDREKRSVGIRFSSTITFTRSTAKMLHTMFVENDCDVVRYEIFEDCSGLRQPFMRSEIILADCRFDLSRCEAECSPVDDGLGSRLENNRKIPITPSGDKTKNGYGMDAAMALPIEMFAPQTGAYLSTPRAMYDWLDAMKHAVEYITDGRMTAVSNWYDALPDSERWAVTSGYQIRTADGSAEGGRVTHTFESLFMELSKKYNLWYGVKRDANGVAYLSIEPEIDFYSDAVGVTLPHTDRLVQSIDRDHLWGSVRVGSSDGIANKDAVWSLPFIGLKGFSEEAFTFASTCNTDAELDLVNSWGLCSNLIEKVLGGDATHDAMPFLVQYDRYMLRATASDWLNPGGLPMLYNEGALNINVLNRYALPSEVSISYAPVQAQFSAERSGSVPNPPFSDNTLGPSFQSPPVPATFDVATDPGGNYTPSYYTAPTQGYYVFRVSRAWEVTENTWPLQQAFIGQRFEQKAARSRIDIVRRNSSNAIIETRVFNDFTWPDIARTSDPSRPLTPVGGYEHTVEAGFVLDAGDTVSVEFSFATTWGDGSGTISMQDRPLSSFATSLVATEGGVLTSIDADAARVVTYEFDRILRSDAWARYLSDPTMMMVVSEGAAPLRPGHVQRAERNIYSGLTQITMISKRSDK